MNPKSKILVVDDTPQNVKLLADLLGVQGFQVGVAYSGQEALDQVKTFEPDLVLLDIIMPDTVWNGITVGKKVADYANTYDILFAPHNSHGVLGGLQAAQLCPTCENFKILEYILPTNTEWNEWVDDPYLPKDGYLELRDRPGLGVDVNEDAITENEYIHWQRTCPVRPDGSTGYI